MGDGMIEIWGKEIPGFLPELGQNVPVLDPYLVDSDSPTAAVVVCPGGAYMGKAPHEGKDIAKWLNTIGISAFVLDYRVRPYRHPVPISDARRAVQFVRANAERFNVDFSKIGIIGFSAGGHLAASTAVYPLEGNPAAEDPVERSKLAAGLFDSRLSGNFYGSITTKVLGTIFWDPILSLN